MILKSLPTNAGTPQHSASDTVVHELHKKKWGRTNPIISCFHVNIQYRAKTETIDHVPIAATETGAFPCFCHNSGMQVRAFPALFLT